MATALATEAGVAGRAQARERSVDTAPALAAAERVDQVVVEREQAGAGQGRAVEGGSGQERDRGVGQDVALMERVGAERGRGGLAPEDVRGLGAVNELHPRRRRRRQ